MRYRMIYAGRKAWMMAFLVPFMVAIAGCGKVTVEDKSPTSPSSGASQDGSETSDGTQPTSSAATLTLYGTVYDDVEGGNPLAGVTVTVNSPSVTTTTDSKGYYEVAIEPGSHTMTFSKSGYETVSETISGSDGEMKRNRVALKRSGQGGGSQYSAVQGCKDTRYNTSNGGQLYDTHVFSFRGPYLGIRVVNVGGSPRIQVLKGDFSSTQLSESQVDAELKGLLLWEARVSNSTTLYPRGFSPGKYYINVYKGKAAAYILDCSGPAG